VKKRKVHDTILRLSENYRLPLLASNAPRVFAVG